MLTGNKDPDREILLRIEDDKVLLSACSADKYTLSLCNDMFFYNRLARKFPNLIKYKPNDMTWKNYYLRVIYYIAKLEEDFNFIFKGKKDPKLYYDILKKYENFEAGIEIASLNGLKDLVEYYVNQSDGDLEYNFAFLNAVLGNDKETIDYIITLGVDNWNTGLYGAAVNGNKELIDFFINKGADDWNLGLEGAARVGNVDLINYFISKGADDWNAALASAAFGGNEMMVSYFTVRALNSGVPIQWNRALNSAAGGGNLDLVKKFSRKQGITDLDLSNAVGLAIRGPNAKEIVEYLISRGFNSWLIGYTYAKIYNNKEMIEFFSEKLNN